jgi:hypothetical protein
MKAKLIKTELEDYHMGHYFLNDTNCYAIGSTDFGWCKTSAGIPKYKLSKENCDEIFGVIDVEELAYENTIDFGDVFDYNDGYGNISNFNNSHEIQEVYIKGFNKAMELNKDKLFTVEDVIKISEYCRSDFDGMIKTSVLVNEYLLLQQPKEIEVEVVMSEIVTDDFVGMQGIPKLDNNGCLILKKI